VEEGEEMMQGSVPEKTENRLGAFEGKNVPDAGGGKRTIQKLMGGSNVAEITHNGHH